MKHDHCNALKDVLKKAKSKMMRGKTTKFAKMKKFVLKQIAE